MLPAHDRGVSREAFPGIVSVPAIIRDVLPNGLRLLTERMPHVRSVSIGVWLSRGSRHEPAAHEGIAHFVEHMLFKGTTTRSAEDIAQQIDSIGGHLDAFTSKEYAGYYIKVLDAHLPRGRRRALGSRHRSGVRPGRNRAREEGRPRRDQDGRGHPRRSRPRDLRRRVLAEASTRPADSRPAGDGVGARPGDASPLLRRRLRRLELHRRGGRQPRARARSATSSSGHSRRCPSAARRSPTSCRRRPPTCWCARRTSSRATSASAARRWPTTTPTATSPSPSTPCSAAR